MYYSSDGSTSSMNFNDNVVPADPTNPNPTDPSSPPSLEEAAAQTSSTGPSLSISGPFPQVKLRIKFGQATPMAVPQIQGSVSYLYPGQAEEHETSGDESSAFRFSAVNPHAVRDLLSAAAVIDDGSQKNGDDNDSDDTLSTPKKETRGRKKAEPGSSSSKRSGKGSKKRGRKGKNDVKQEMHDEDGEEGETKEENGDAGEDEDEVFEVEKIYDHMWDEDGELKYKVRWVGYAEEWDTYEPVAVLGSATQRINEYKRSLPVETRQELEAGCQKKSKKKGRPSKGASTPKAKKPRRSEESLPMPSDEESDDDKEDKEDDDFKMEGGASTSRSRGGKGRAPKSKGELKLFEKPKRTTTSNEPRPKRQFLQNRQGWLDESDSNASDSEAEKKKEEKKEEKKERRVTESPAPKKETGRKRGGTVEQTPVPVAAPVTNGRHARGATAALVEGMYRHESGEVDVLISEGRSQRIVPLKEAHDIAGFGLVQFLADRFQFQA